MSKPDALVWVEPRAETGGQTAAGTFQVPVEQAFQQLLDGKLRLSKLQSGPLLSLLDALSDRVRAVDSIGPKLLPGSSEAFVNQKILRSGVRQDFVEGQTLQWVQGPRKLRSLAENGWVSITSRRATLLDDLRFQYSKMASKLPQDRVHELPPREGMERDRIVEVPFDRIALPYRLTCQLSPDWYAFHQRLEALKREVEDAIGACISETRILAIEERGAVSLQISPARDMASHPRGTTWYLLTRDLPEAWFREKPGKRDAERKAAAWLVRAGRECQVSGKRMSRTDGMEVMTAQFGLSRSAAERLWSTADHPSKGQGGRIPSHQRISLKEIREIK